MGGLLWLHDRRRCDRPPRSMMEAILAVAVLLVVPAAIIGAAMAWTSRAAGRRAKRRAAAWARVARRLGLTFGADGVHGEIEGQAVRLVYDRRGTGRQRCWVTEVSCRFVPAFDLGLGVWAARPGLWGAFDELVGGSDIELGDPAFDRDFVLRADEPERARVLLSPELRRILVATLRKLSKSSWLQVDDSGSSIVLRPDTTDAPLIESCLTAVARVARLMNDARDRIPVAGPLRPQREAWAAYAEAAGLRVTDCPLCMSGRMGGAAISAHAVRVASSRYRIEVLVRFDAPLGLGLFVRPTGGLEAIGLELGRGDVELGDPTFDRAFSVKIARPEALSRLLDAETRRRVLDLQAEVDALQIRDDGVTLRVERLDLDATLVPRVVGRARPLVSRIAENAATVVPASVAPYR